MLKDKYSIKLKEKMMACRKGSMRWKKAMKIVRKQYPKLSLKRRERIAGAIISKKK